VNADELQRLYVSAEHELLLTEKWNSIEAIAEDLDVFVTKNKKVCLDIVEVQSLIGFAIDDFWEIFKRKLMDYKREEAKR
jgi:hypothetical protein